MLLRMLGTLLEMNMPKYVSTYAGKIIIIKVPLLCLRCIVAFIYEHAALTMDILFSILE